MNNGFVKVKKRKKERMMMKMKMKRGLLTIVVIGFENEKLRSSKSQQYQ